MPKDSQSNLEDQQTTANPAPAGDVTRIEQFSLLDMYLGKRVTLTTTIGRPIICRILKISAYEILVEVGKNDPSQQLIFKHSISSITLRDD